MTSSPARSWSAIASRVASSCASWSHGGSPRHSSRARTRGGKRSRSRSRSISQFGWAYDPTRLVGIRTSRVSHTDGYTPALVMPKMKSHSGAKKRLKKTATGKLQGRHAFSSHILEKKSPKRKREMGLDRPISKADGPVVRKLLGGNGR